VSHFSTGQQSWPPARLDHFYAAQTSLRAEIAALQAQLRAKQDLLQELESAGTPKQKYAEAVAVLERQVSGLGGALLETLNENAAQRIYGIPLAELSRDTQGDVKRRYQKELGRFTSGFYLRLGRPRDIATAEQVEAQTISLLEDIDSLLNSEHFAE
jgi:hypothetical protein